MLVLTRRVGEKIRIGDDVVITLLGIRGNQYKIGIDAPISIRVNREEIWQRMQDPDSCDTPVELLDKVESRHD